MTPLSPRETLVLELASKGATDSGIAHDMNVSVATVRGYWLRIRSKLGGTSRAQLVGQWIQAKADTVTSARDASDVEAAVDRRSKLDLERAASDRVFDQHATSGERQELDDLRGSTDESED